MVRRYVVVGGAMAGLAAVALLVVYSLFAGSGGAEPRQLGTAGALRAGNRETLEVCVEFVKMYPWQWSAQTRLAFENVEFAVEDVAADPYWTENVPQRDIASTANVDVGCPAGIPPQIGRGVDRPSRYLLFIFIMLDTERSSFVWRNYDHGTQEFTCDGDSCGGTTIAIYFGLSETRDPEKMAAVLSDAIGLPGRARR